MTARNRSIAGLIASLMVVALGVTIYLATRSSVPPPPASSSRGSSPEVSAAAPAPTAFGKAWEFLYSGDHPQQTGVKKDAIDARRAAVLHGRVLTRDGDPVAGATIAVEGHAEFGATQSGQDGAFALAVNGGGLLCVHYHKDGLLALCRQVAVPWRDHAWLPDVAMTKVDSAVSTIDLTDAAPFQVAQGSVVKDDDGERRGTLLMPQGEKAELILPDGKKESVSTLHVRLTEYTVGKRGPAAMPASLPANSAYTYAFELTADEVTAKGVKINGKDLLLSKPAIFYVDNFLKLPAGVPVPMGYFDTTTAAWIPSDSGRVVKVLAVKDGLADLDVDGSDKSAGADALAKLGITEAERRQVATLYKPGQGLWRVTVPHFSTWDPNMSGSPPTDADPPDGGGDGDDNDKDPCDTSGSLIEIQNQVLGEKIGLVGVPYHLHYLSRRVPGRAATRALKIHVSGKSLPKSLKRIELEVLIAGQRFSKTDFPPQPNQDYTFIWDGKDGQGRPVAVSQMATVRIGNVYDGVYQMNPRFGSNGNGTLITGSRTRQEVTLWTEFQRPLGTWDARQAGLGGWSFGVHHAYDPIARVLYLGDGRQIGGNDLGRPGLNQTIAALAGGGTKAELGDGGRATEARLDNFKRTAGAGFARNRQAPAEPFGVVLGPDGALYVADDMQRVRRVGPDGVITTFAGGGTKGLGDGQPATQAELSDPRGLCFGPDGSLYIADAGHNCIRRVAPDGTISTSAGTGEKGFGGDGGPAKAAKLRGPLGVAVAPDGTLYIADTNNNCIRRVGPDGVIETLAGKPVLGQSKDDWPGYGGDGGPAVQARVYWPTAVVLAADGALYVADTGNYLVRRIGANGVITTVAGTPPPQWWAASEPSGLHVGYGGDGGPALKAVFKDPTALAVTPDGTVFIADTLNHRLRKITAQGVVVTVAGTDKPGSAGDGGPAFKAQLDNPAGLALAPDGDLYIYDGCYRPKIGTPSFRIRRVATPLPGFADDDFALASPDGSELYRFDKTGRDLQTLDAATGSLRYRFGYDDEARLTKIEDAYGNVTTIERDDHGRPTAVVGPFGARTKLSVDTETGYLKSVTNPADETVSFTYHSKDGLLATFKDARGNASRFSYDDMGRLVKDEDAAGGFTALARRETPQGIEIALTTAEKKVPTTYLTERKPSGEEIHLNKCCCGAETKSLTNVDDSRTVTYPDGSVLTSTDQPDPRWGMLAPLPNTFSLATPGGRKLAGSFVRQVVLAKAGDPLSLATVTDTMTVNSRSYIRTFDTAKRQIVTKTPAGRLVVTTLDDRSRLAKVEVPGMLPISYGYDKQGRLTAIRQGEGDKARSVAIEYDADGRAGTITDPLKRKLRLEYDKAGRVTKRVMPDGREIAYAYDTGGLLKSLTPPGRPAHGFDSTLIGLPKQYSPPAVGDASSSTSYEFNKDRQMTRMAGPGGEDLALAYNAMGQLETVTFGVGQLRIAYDPKTEQLKTLAAPDESLVYDYDGSLLTRTSWDGAVKGSIGREYDNDLRVTGCSVNGGALIANKYDPDGLLIQAGGLSIDRDPASGYPMGTRLGKVATRQEYNGFGEVKRFSAAYDGKDFLVVEYERDLLGRIVKRTETIDGKTAAYVYGYDRADRLADVTKDGAPVAHYDYDANGNRLAYKGPNGLASATYDAQDRLLKYGEGAWNYTGSGRWSSATVEGKTTKYAYDVLGNLRGVELPDGMKIEYVLDGANRRVGKKLNGKLVQGFLYQGALRPIAELDGQGNVVSRFVYTTKVNMPDYFEKGGKTYRIVTDHLGSPRVVIEANSGKVVQRLDFDEFGKVLEDTQPGYLPFGFAGGLYDAGTKLTRFGARDYDAVTGRWTAQDPIGFASGQSNLYAYLDNGPINAIDPDGFSFWSPSIWSIATGGLAVWKAAETELAAQAAEAGGAVVAATPWSGIGTAVVGAAALGVGIGMGLDWGITQGLGGESLGGALGNWYYGLPGVWGPPPPSGGFGPFSGPFYYHPLFPPEPPGQPGSGGGSPCPK